MNSQHKYSSPSNILLNSNYVRDTRKKNNLAVYVRQWKCFLLSNIFAHWILRACNFFFVFFFHLFLFFVCVYCFHCLWCNVRERERSLTSFFWSYLVGWRKKKASDTTNSSNRALLKRPKEHDEQYNWAAFMYLSLFFWVHFLCIVMGMRSTQLSTTVIRRLYEMSNVRLGLCFVSRI